MNNRIINYSIVFFSIITLFITYKITMNNYDDNVSYSRSYTVLKEQTITAKYQKNYKENSYYLINTRSYKEYYPDSDKYFLVSKKREDIDINANIIQNSKYYLFNYDYIINHFGPKYVKENEAYYLRNKQTLVEASDSYLWEVGSKEPVYFYLSYIAVDFMSYDFFILILNILFLSVVYLFLQKLSINYKIIFLVLLLTDSYLYSFLANIHRLKLAILFFLLSLIIYNKSKYLMVITSIFSHLQITVFYLYRILFDLITSIKNKRLLKDSKRYILFLFLIAILGYYFWDHIAIKLFYYSEYTISYKVSLVIAFYSSYLYYFKHHNTFELFLPLAILVFVVSFIVGESRVNFALMEFIFIVELNRLFDKKTHALIVVAPLVVYSFYKTYSYISAGLQ